MSPETKENLGSTSKFGITLGSGVVAGFAAAILSHVSPPSRLPLTPILLLALVPRSSNDPP